jgi:hypothetical protein
MNWFATIVSLLLILLGSVHIFRPRYAAKWDKFVGSPIMTPLIYKVIGYILISFGLIFIIVFNYISVVSR